MENKNDRQLLSFLYRSLIFLMSYFVLLIVCGLLYLSFGDVINDWMKPTPQVEVKRNIAKYDNEDNDKIEHGIHLASGLIAAKGFEIVKANCTACHSAKLITQNRATKEGWEAMIEWMQATQGLWDLGKNEPIILDYLATNYAPEEVGRRANLEEVAYYMLDLSD